MKNESKKKLLLVEDEPHLALNLVYNLQSEGYEVISTSNGRLGLSIYEEDGPFDLVLLDVMLPELNGFEIAKKIREKNPVVGILIITAKSSEADRLHGLNVGVDDYLVKPFSLQEFLLRVKRMLERSDYFDVTGGDSKKSAQNVLLRSGPFTLNMDRCELMAPGGTFILTLLEAKLLKEFFSSVNKVITREHLLANVWGFKAKIETRTIDNFIMRLRRYLETDPSHPVYLLSVRGRGYRYNLPTPEA